MKKALAFDIGGTKIYSTIIDETGNIIEEIEKFSTPKTIDGISKLSILGQYIAEVLLIAVLAFSLSYFSASAIAGQMGNVLQSRQAVSEVQQEDGLSAGTRGEAGTNIGEQEIETPELQVRVQLEEMGLLFLIGIVIVTVSAGISSISVMRLKPREILSKMS